MPVKLTKAALDELQRSARRMQADSGKRMVPCLVWCLSVDQFHQDEARRWHRGPGLAVGGFDEGGDHTGYELINQDGVEFLLSTLPDINKDANTLIGFHFGKWGIA